MRAALLTRAAAQLGCELVYVPAGPFVMGCAIDPGDSAARFDAPRHEVTLPGYAIGRFPVTNASFARFIAEGGYETPAWWSTEGWQVKESGDRRAGDPPGAPLAWTAPARSGERGFSDPTQPVVGVHWYEAEAYCRWLSQQSGLEVVLPTEAEWEKAARGTDGRLYPWGDEPPTPARCTCQLSWQTGAPSPVGRCSPQGDSPYGCADMAGNVLEWTCSPFLAYPFCLEPRVTTGSVVARGGAWSFPADGVRCARRHGFNSRVQRERDGQIVRPLHVGFRVVVLPQSSEHVARDFLRERIADVDPELLVNQLELYAHVDAPRLRTGVEALEALLGEPGQDALLYALVTRDAAWALDPSTPASARRWLEELVRQCRRELAENATDA